MKPQTHTRTVARDLEPAAQPPGGRTHWKLSDVDLSRADLRHHDDSALFYMLAGASFVESGSAIYLHNLLGYYGDDAQIGHWLRNQWEPEELQHGAALRAYLAVVWPEFDWAKAYGAFVAEYSLAAAPDAFEATARLELAARCMIETGTATLYRMLHRYASEPVLREVLGHILEDEVRHYRHFLRFFRDRQTHEGGGRLEVIGAIVRRVRESRTDDAWIAFRHAFELRNPGRPCRRGDFNAWQSAVHAIMRRTFPFRMAAQMLLAPLALPVYARPLARRAAEAGLRWMLLA